MAGEDRGGRHTREEMLQAAKASPEAVAGHDKQAWTGLFAKRAIVEDPVGSTPSRCVIDEKTGKRDISQLEKFYDTFIAPNNIAFNVYRDIVAENVVVRDLDIMIESSTGLRTTLHSYIFYEFIEEEGRLKISRLAAYWELAGMIRQVLLRGWPGIKMMAVLGMRMLRVQGLSGVWGYMRGLGGVGRRGKERVQEFSRALNDRDAGSIVRLFHPGSGVVEFPANGGPVSPGSLLDLVSGSFSVSDPISSGSSTGFRFDASMEGISRQGIGLFEFTDRGRLIERARLFWEDF
ncbi:MAG: hypothetical protein R6U89_02820 [Dehalococcoidia bacterium]